MSTMFGRVGGALAKAQELASQHDVDEQQRKQQAEMQALQRQAILSGLQDKQTAQASQQTTLTRRVALLKRNPKFSGYDDESLAGIASDEPTFSKVVGESLLTPKRQNKPVLVGGKPTLALEDESGGLFDRAGNPIADAQPYQAPTQEKPGRLEGKNGYVEIVNGKPTFTPYPAGYQPNGNSQGADSPMMEMRKANLISTIRGQFNGDQTLKDAQQIQTALAKISSAASGPHTATNDMALIFGIQKLQDPTSSVREGEYATAANAANWPARARDLYNLTIRNHLLPDETRAEFLQTARQIAGAQRKVFQSTISRYSDIAKRQGVDPRDVVYDPYEGLFDAGGAGGGDDEAAWVAKNPAKKGESFEAYHQRFLKSRGG